jgi:hypothetical protein
MQTERKSLKMERNSTVRVLCERLTVRISLRLCKINKTAKGVVGYFILSILTDLCSILSKRNIICRYRVNSWNRDDFLPAEFHAGIVWTGSISPLYVLLGIVTMWAWMLLPSSCRFYVGGRQISWSLESSSDTPAPVPYCFTVNYPVSLP